MSDMQPNELAFLKSALKPAGDCPDVAALLASLAGADENPELQQHLAGCSRCRMELAMLREFESGEPRADELASVQWIQRELVRRAPEFANAVSAPRPLSIGERSSIGERLSAWVADIFSPRRRFALSMAGVCLLLIAGAGIYSQRGGEAPLTNPAHSMVFRSGQFSAVSPVGDVTQIPTGFQWESVPGAVKYAIHLSGVDGAEAWSAESTETSIEPPREIRNLLKPGRAFHWKVDALNAAGEKIASTDSQIFHILATIR